MAWQKPLEEVLVVEPVGEDRFRASLDGFGGVTVGCATIAASRSCEDRALSSLHTYFLRPVPTDRPVDLVVERMRDGRRLAHRRVQIRAGDKLCGELVASFAAPGEGAEFGDARVDPGTPAPDTLPTEDDVAREEGWTIDEPSPLYGPLEWRFIGGVPWRTLGPKESSRYRAWVRPRFPLPDDRPLHQGALAFLCDYHSHMSVARRIGLAGPPVGFSSLDQVLWLHRDLPWDGWRLITTECDVAHGGRALSRRMLFTAEGTLIASMAQEQLIPAVGGR
ncbi:MAG: acyl-CoA thioesterase domain-containing protein [Myxococcota bacterium]